MNKINKNVLITSKTIINNIIKMKKKDFPRYVILILAI